MACLVFAAPFHFNAVITAPMLCLTPPCMASAWLISAPQSNALAPLSNACSKQCRAGAFHFHALPSRCLAVRSKAYAVHSISQAILRIAFASPIIALPLQRCAFPCLSLPLPNYVSRCHCHSTQLCSNARPSMPFLALALLVHAVALPINASP